MENSKVIRNTSFGFKSFHNQRNQAIRKVINSDASPQDKFMSLQSLIAGTAPCNNTTFYIDLICDKSPSLSTVTNHSIKKVGSDIIHNRTINALFNPSHKLSHNDYLRQFATFNGITTNGNQRSYNYNLKLPFEYSNQKAYQMHKELTITE